MIAGFDIEPRLVIASMAVFYQNKTSSLANSLPERVDAFPYRTENQSRLVIEEV